MTESVAITLRLGIGFEDLIEASSDADEHIISLADGSSLQSVVDRVGLTEKDRFLTAINDSVVVKSDRSSTQVKSGDVVEILPPLTGG